MRGTPILAVLSEIANQVFRLPVHRGAKSQVAGDGTSRSGHAVAYDTQAVNKRPEVGLE